MFIRRELRVWPGLDVEVSHRPMASQITSVCSHPFNQFLTTFTISLMKSLDIRSEPAVRLLSEFLDMDAEHGHEHDNAEHFAHGQSVAPI